MKSGFVTIIGNPNVGKSTILNKIIGEKISIVSNKPQTTRNKITGIYNDNEVQIVFLDTPGVHRARNKLDKFMLREISASIRDVDAIVYVVDRNIVNSEILNNLKDIPVILVVNKIDLLTKEKILEFISKFSDAYNFHAIIPVSARLNDGVNILLDELKKLMPEGPLYYPSDISTTSTEQNIVCDIIREKCLIELREEIPHGIAVKIDRFKAPLESEFSKKRKYDIISTIYCEKESHKGIIIGKGGTTLKKIATDARLEIEQLLGDKVYLELFVKFKKNWREKSNLLKELGYEG